MTVRRMGPGDQDAVRSLLQRFKGYETPQPEAFLSDPRAFLFVAEDGKDGKTAVGWLYGYELIRPEGRRAMLLYEVEVAPDARGRGHGRALVEALMTEARGRGHLEMWVLTDDDNASAAALYTSTGAERAPQTMFTWNFD